MITCVFCGAQDPVHAKHLLHSSVMNLLQRQRDAGICEPVLNFMSCKLAADAACADALAGNAHGRENAGDAPTQATQTGKATPTAQATPATRMSSPACAASTGSRGARAQSRANAHADVAVVCQDAEVVPR